MPSRVIVATNSLILLLPPRLFGHDLLPLFEAHFRSYGHVVTWTPLEKLGRVLVVYEEIDQASEARREMDNFVWDDEPRPSDPRPTQGSTDAQASTSGTAAAGRMDDCYGAPLRVFFGPLLPLPLPSLHSTLLSVPALSRNFLISPPGSPPVGWEQTLEEAPNPNPLPDDNAPDHGWAQELARALRYLSVDAEVASDEADESDQARRPHFIAEDVTATLTSDPEALLPTTRVIVPPMESTSRPSITISTAPTMSPGSNGQGTPPPGAGRITTVKATIESLLGRKRSSSDLRNPRSPGSSTLPTVEESLKSLKSSIKPTALPPLNGDGYLASAELR